MLLFSINLKFQLLLEDVFLSSTTVQEFVDDSGFLLFSFAHQGCIYLLQFILQFIFFLNIFYFM